MPDDGPRPLQENSPGQSNDAPPAWWGDLGRADLPDDKGRQSVWLTLDAIPAPPPARRPHRWMARVVNALVFVAVVIAATLIAIVPENRSKLWALIGIPVLAGALLGVALAVFRRGRF